MINKINKFIEIAKIKANTKSVLKNIENSDDKDITMFLEVFNFLKNDKKWQDEEIKAFKTINDIRLNYKNSKSTVSITDYGAGSPNSSRTKEQMKEGICNKNIVSDVYKRASTPTKWSELIFKIIREFKPQNCLELGTCLGISGAYQLLALKLNGLGTFNTIEGANELAEIANSSLKKLNYDNYKVHSGRFIDILPTILNKDYPIDFVFIDGHHDETATIEYYNIIYPFLSQKAVVIFDDINWSAGMKKAWKQIHTKGKGIKASFDLYKWGISLIDKETQKANNLYFQLAY